MYYRYLIFNLLENLCDREKLLYLCPPKRKAC